MYFDWFDKAHHRYAQYKQRGHACRQAGSALPFLILAVTAVIGGYIWFSNYSKDTIVSPQVKEMSSTYISSGLNFQFIYPKGLTAKEDTEAEFNKRGNGDFRKNFKGYVGYEPVKFRGAVVVYEKENFETNPFTIWVFDNPESLTIEKWYDLYWYYPFVWGDFTTSGKLKLSPSKEATVSGEVAKLTIVDYQPGSPTFIYLAKNNNIYLLRIIDQKGEEILKTFKFTP